jgi:uncharacterized secreted protein with C-terminal beta-propeller domain
MSDNLRDRLRRLSERGTERGADTVFTAASTEPVPRTGSSRFGSRDQFSVVTAIAAAVLLLAGVAGAMVIDRDNRPVADKPSRFASGTTTTTGASTTSTSQLPPPPSTPKIYLAQTRMVPFNSCPSLAGYAKRRALDTVSAYGLPYAGGGPIAMFDQNAAAGRASDSGSAPAAAPVTAAPEFSGTNVQEAGIDEPDSVKTDGKTIFAVSNNKVFATRAGSAPALVGSVEVVGAQELLLIGTKLIVISNGGAYAIDDAPSGSRAMIMRPYYPQPSRFSVYDVSDPAAMRFTGSFDVEGSYISARLVDGVARFAVRSYPKLDFTYPTDSSQPAQDAALAHNRDVINATSADTWLPHFTVTSASGQTSKSEALTSCGDSYRPPSFSGFGMLSVITFNLDKPADSTAASVMADGDTVYASADRMYVSTTAWDSVQNQTVAPAPNTLVHAFDIRSKTQATYLASGKVRGSVLNQFSLSEHNGLLRVATTDPTGGSESFLTVLQNNGEALVPIGQVGGLGHGERIYGVRFIDDAAYVVTFRQVDPLYVVELSDPTKPAVKGELKITGYSAYLHPIGPGRLLGIGQEATPEGRRAGVQASIFDVSDPASPKLVTRTVVGGNSYTSAEYDHHAFLYWAPAKLAVLPLSVYDQSQQFNGAIGMHVEDAGISEVGRMQPPSQNGYSPGIERNIVIGDRLYAVGYGGVLVNTLELKSVSWVPYPQA